MAFIIAFTRRGKVTEPTPPVKLEIAVPLDDLDRLPEILLHLTVAAQLAARVAMKREYGDETVLEGIRQVFEAFGSLFGL